MRGNVSEKLNVLRYAFFNKYIDSFEGIEQKKEDVPDLSDEEPLDLTIDDPFVTEENLGLNKLFRQKKEDSDIFKTDEPLGTEQLFSEKEEKPEPKKEEKPEPKKEEKPAPEPIKPEPIKPEPIKMEDLAQPKQKPAPQPPPQTRSFMHYSITDIFSSVAALGNRVLSWFKPSPAQVREDIVTKETLEKVQQPYKDAAEKSEKDYQHNLNLCKMIEKPDGSGIKSKTELDEDEKKANRICDISRSRVMAYSMFMLHKGMPLEQIVSSDTSYDADKKKYIAEFHGILMKAADAVHEAGEKAGEEAGKDFDKNFDKEKFIENIDEKKREQLFSDAFKNKDPNQITSEERAEIRKKALDDYAEERRRYERSLHVTSATKKAEHDAIEKHPHVQEYKDVYLKMGQTLANTPIPAKSVTNMKDVTDKFSQLALLNL
ncbi:MAG: hypothetical protein FWD19_04305, partial [Defluviitaleaceae bacterium]|nr:hypothetical protein [Defluviitaleaceae bacterium]